MKNYRVVVLHIEDVEFVADALKFFATYEGCEPPVQARTKELSKFFRGFLSKAKPTRAASTKGARKAKR